MAFLFSYPSQLCHADVLSLFAKKGASEMNAFIYGVDIAKNVFQLHWVDPETGEVCGKQIKRSTFLSHFANRERCLIGMEACGGSQHWARRLAEMVHEVKLLPRKAVKAFVHGNNNNVADARAIWLAVQQPGIKTVAIKTEAQQAVLPLRRMRQQLVKFRTMQSNGLRGLLAEFGEVMPGGRSALTHRTKEALQRLSDRLPAMMIDTLREQWNMLTTLDQQIEAIEKRLLSWLHQDKACKTIACIPGVGPLTATAAVATMGDARAFKSGREFAAWLGLVPAQTGTGGRVRLLGISKRGDTYLRTLLIHGARSAVTHAKEPNSWVIALGKRRPHNVVVVALPNKIARTIWALLAHDRQYVSVKR
jgi:transposase